MNKVHVNYIYSMHIITAGYYGYSDGRDKRTVGTYSICSLQEKVIHQYH